MTGDLYIESVIGQIPPGLPLRDQIAMELRSHIAERMASGQPLDEILKQLGDPGKLAESYLSAVPLKNASILARLVAKIVDAVLVATMVAIAVGVPTLVLSRQLPPDSSRPVLWFGPFVTLVLSMFAFIAYTIDQEYRRGATVGKRMMGIRVVQESGAKITLGQAALRQLPFFGQFFFIDALFVLFTKKRQRAFEMITKTRAVAAASVVLADSR
jgi:uncharacterized RDD family membrane protein YckC